VKLLIYERKFWSTVACMNEWEANEVYHHP